MAARPGTTIREKRIKRTKSPRTQPNRPKKKPYRGQGKVK
jgi:hypothetical protein